MSRIAIVINSDIFRERSRRELVEHLASLGHDVVVIAPADIDSARKAAWRCRFWNWPLEQHGVNPFREISAISALARVFRKERPDVVLNFRLKATLYGTIAAMLTGVPQVNTLFTGLGHYFGDEKRMRSPLGRAIRLALRVILRRSRIVFFQNPDDLELFERYGLVLPEQGCVIPGSGVDIHAFSPRMKTEIDDRFVLITRLLRDKGVVEFCEAARNVRETHSNARFILAGPSGSEPTAIRPVDLEPWTKDGTVEYLGEISDVRGQIAEATAVVLPSYYAEGVPRSLLEALAMGRAVITTDMPGCRMTVEDSVNGYLIPPRDALALAEAVTKLIGSPENVRRMGEFSRKLAIEKFDVDLIVTQLADALFPGSAKITPQAPTAHLGQPTL